MFYIVREYHSSGGGAYGLPYNSWYEYSIEISRPNSNHSFVKIDKTKEQLKSLSRSKGSLENALNYLYDITKDDEQIEEWFK